MSITKRDEEGKVVKGGKELSSEEAAAMASKRWDNTKAAEAEGVHALLRDLGWDDDAPETANLLAEVAASKGSRSIQALRELIKISGRYRDQDNTAKFIEGEPCPTCGKKESVEHRLGIDSQEDLKQLLDTVISLKENVLQGLNEIRRKHGLDRVRDQDIDWHNVGDELTRLAG